MKKITIKVFLGITMLASLFANAQLTENFDAGTALPAGWSIINSGDANGWVVGTPGGGTAHSGANVAKLVYGATAHLDYLISPAITVTTGVSDHLGFWVRHRSNTFPEPYELLLSTTGTNEADFTTTLAAAVTPTATWAEMSYSLSAYAGQTVYIAWKSTTTDQWELYIDDVVVDVAAAAVPVCSTVVSPTDGAVNVPTGNVTFAWTAVAGATSYDMFYGLTAGNATTLVGNFTGTSAAITLNGFNTTFYWKIVPKNSAGSAIGCPEWSFTTVPPPAVPANDDCANAIAVASFPYTNTQDATSATNNAGVITACVGGMNDGVWYTIVGNGSSLEVNVTAVVGWDPELGIYTGTCGALACVSSTDIGGTSGDETYVILNSVLGTTYYINVGHYNGATDTAEGPFTIEVTSLDTTPPANDALADAAAVACGSTVIGDTTYATLDQDSAPDGFGADMDAPNVWYSFTGSGVAQTVTLDLCGSAYDTSVLVYTEIAGVLTIVAANDDDATCGAFPLDTRSRVSFTSDGTTTYLIAVEGWNAASVGSFTMDVTCAVVNPPAVANQTCALALGINVDNTDVLSDNSFGDVSATQPSCDTFGTVQDVWFSFVAPASGSVDVNVSNGSMTSSNFTVYSGDCAVLTQVAGACNANIATTLTESLTALMEGSTYYVQVWSGATEQGTFSLRLSDPSLATTNFETSNFKVYPNPVKNILNLSYDQNISNVSVFNLLGQEVIAKSVNSNLSQIDMSHLANGTYMVKVSADNFTKTIKVVKQ